MAIYVEFEKPDTVEEFVSRFFNVNNLPDSSGWSDSFAVRTYKNKDCTIIQSDAGKYRSPQDLFECVTTYLPEASLKEVLSAVKNLRPDSRYPHFGYCSTIRRPIIYFIPYTSSPHPEWEKFLLGEGLPPNMLNI